MTTDQLIAAADRNAALGSWAFFVGGLLLAALLVATWSRRSAATTHAAERSTPAMSSAPRSTPSG